MVHAIEAAFETQYPMSAEEKTVFSRGNQGSSMEEVALGPDLLQGQCVNRHVWEQETLSTEDTGCTVQDTQRIGNSSDKKDLRDCVGSTWRW